MSEQLSPVEQKRRINKPTRIVAALSFTALAAVGCTSGAGEHNTKPKTSEVPYTALDLGQHYTSSPLSDKICKTLNREGMGKALAPNISVKRPCEAEDSAGAYDRSQIADISLKGKDGAPAYEAEIHTTTVAKFKNESSNPKFSRSNVNFKGVTYPEFHELSGMSDVLYKDKKADKVYDIFLTAEDLNSPRGEVVATEQAMIRVFDKVEH